MRKVIYVLVCLVVFLNLFGCEKEGWKGKDYDITSYNDLLEAFNDMDYTIEEIKPVEDEVSHSFFSVNALNIKVNKEIISIFEFKDPETAKSEVETISDDGFRVGNSFISWIDTPHFFQKGNLIVCYVGKNKTLLSDLSVTLGKSLIN